VAELNLSGSTAIPAGASINLGEIYNPQFTEFGVVPEDYLFEYSTPEDEILNGAVELTGGARPNNLALVIDPATGAGEIINTSPTTVSIDAFGIRSASGSLTPDTWTAQGGDWIEIGSNANQLGELLTVGELTLAEDQGFDLGVIADPSDIGVGEPGRDLVFEFLMSDDQDPFLGVVVYGNIRAGDGITAGDLNGDGLVNFGDLTPFVKALTDIPGYEAMFPGIDRVAACDVSGDGLCNFGDLTPFVSLLTGGPGSATSVPEPTSLCLCICTLLVVFGRRRTYMIS
jgi:hypothetical protein